MATVLAAGRGDFIARAVLTCVVVAALTGCSGRAQRERIGSALRLSIAPEVTSVTAGDHLALRVTLRNSGQQRINICLKNEDGAALTDSGGKRWPLKLVSVVFDAECSEIFALDPGAARIFEDNLAIWPGVAPGIGTLDVWLSYSVKLGQFYWPGTAQRLTDKRSLLIRARPAP